MWICKICETRNDDHLNCCNVCLYERMYSDSLLPYRNKEPIVKISAELKKQSVSSASVSEAVHDSKKFNLDETERAWKFLRGERIQGEELDLDDKNIVNYIFNEDGTILVKYRGKSRKVRVPDGIKKIGISCFECNKFIEVVTFPHTVEVIEERAFSDCSELCSVSMSCLLTDIRKGAFINCERLADFMISDCIKSIDPSAFKSCLSMRTICGLFSPAWFYAKKYGIQYKIRRNLNKLKSTYCSKCWGYIAHFSDGSVCSSCWEK